MQNNHQMKKAYIILAPGFELLEATAPIDVLERCGVQVEKVAAHQSLLVPSSHSVFLKADTLLQEQADVDRILSDADMVILPGGYPGYENLSKNSLVGAILAGMESSGRKIAAICGAPSALAVFGIAGNSKITCHSSVKELMASRENGQPAYFYTGNEVEKDGNLTTGRGAGVSLQFAFACASELVPEDMIAEVKRKMEISS